MQLQTIGYKPVSDQSRPGIYDIGMSSLQMKEYVDIEVRGEDDEDHAGGTQQRLASHRRNDQGCFECGATILAVENTEAGPETIALLNLP